MQLDAYFFKDKVILLIDGMFEKEWPRRDITVSKIDGMNWNVYIVV